MVEILRTNSDNPVFRKLVEELDRDLYGINGEEQGEYDKHNVIDYLDTVVICYKDSKPVGCGAFKELNRDSIELKRIYVNSNYRGKGLSKGIVRELQDWGREQGYTRGVLETGKLQYAAIGLYKSLGFSVIDNYEPYIGLSNSVCMSRTL